MSSVEGPLMRLILPVGDTKRDCIVHIPYYHLKEDIILPYKRGESIPRYSKTQTSAIQAFTWVSLGSLG